jgi:ATPase subunit of ABC transporter with duplicated ATPase domains
MELKAKLSGSGIGVYRSRKKELERRTEDLENRPSLNSFQIFFENFEVEKKSSKVIVKIKDLNFKFPNTKNYIFSKVNLNLTFGERVAIIGRNGSGKTTLLKLIMKELISESGIVSLGENVSVGYFGQIENEYGNISPIEIFQRNKFSLEKSHSICSNLGLTDMERNQSYSKMSGGQKTRLRLALLAIKNPDFIILDEPTNHLDNNSCDFIIKFISEYKGTLLVVSHDQNFLKTINLKKF